MFHLQSGTSVFVSEFVSNWDLNKTFEHYDYFHIQIARWFSGDEITILLNGNEEIPHISWKPCTFVWSRHCALYYDFITNVNVEKIVIKYRRISTIDKYRICCRALKFCNLITMFVLLMNLPIGRMMHMTKNNRKMILTTIMIQFVQQFNLIFSLPLSNDSNCFSVSCCKV
jgi:hypothetical protein